MFYQIYSTATPQEELLRIFEHAKSLLNLHQDVGIEFWRNIDETALEVWIREDFVNKSELLNSRSALTDLRELLSRYLEKMRCAAEWVNRIVEVDANHHFKPDKYYSPSFLALCHDYPELIRDYYRHSGLSGAILELMNRWYMPVSTASDCSAQFLPHTLIKAADNDPLARFLAGDWHAGHRYYADRDLLKPIIGTKTNERKVLIVPRAKTWQKSPHALASANATPVIEKGLSNMQLTETFADGLLRLAIPTSHVYLQSLRSRIAVLYLFDTCALFVEYPWCRFGSGQRRLNESDVIKSKKRLDDMGQYPVERNDELDVFCQSITERIDVLPKWRIDALGAPCDTASKS